MLLGCDLKSAYRYVRFDWAPDLSAASNTASMIASATLAGFDRLASPTTAICCNVMPPCVTRGGTSIRQAPMQCRE